MLMQTATLAVNASVENYPSSYQPVFCELFSAVEPGSFAGFCAINQPSSLTKLKLAHL